MNFFKKLIYSKKLNIIIETGKENFINENYFTSIKDFTFALEIDNKNEEALLNRGMVFYKAKHFKAVEVLFNCWYQSKN